MRHTCSTWYGKLGIAGGVLALGLIGFVLFLGYNDSARAGTCQGITTFVFDQVPTAQQWNDNFAAACNAILSLDDSNISALAGIQWSKMEDPNNFTAFTDHSARHEPGGSDEVGDIDILNTGTNVSVHASRHQDGGADPLVPNGISLAMLASSVQTLLSARSAHAVETALNRSQTFIGDVRAPYILTGLTADVGRDMVLCNGFLYVAIDDSSTGLDYLVKIVASTMTADPNSPLALVAEDNPVDLECAPDGSVLILTSGNAGAVNPSLKKMSATDVLTTIHDYETGESMDAALALKVDPDGSHAYVVGGDTGDVDNIEVFRTQISDGTTTKHLWDDDPDAELQDLEMWENDGVLNVAVLLHEDQVTNYCSIRTCAADNIAACDLTTDNGAGTDDLKLFDSGVAATSCWSMAFDGEGFWVWDQAGTNVAVYHTARSIICKDTTVATGALTGCFTVPKGTTNPHTLDHFDGRRMIWQQPGSKLGIVNLPPVDVALDPNNIYNAPITGTPAGCGMASDGAFLYVCTYTSSGTALNVTKNLM